MITLNKTIKRQTKAMLPAAAGKHRGRPLVVRLQDGDLLVLRPKRCHAKALEVRISLFEIYFNKMGQLYLS